MFVTAADQSRLAPRKTASPFDRGTDEHLITSPKLISQLAPLSIDDKGHEWLTIALA